MSEMSEKKPEKQYSKEEISLHNKDGDLWVLIDGIVYDLSKFQERHPGGKKILLAFAGKDATKKFQKTHGPNTMRRYGDPLRIGTAKQTKEGSPTSKSFFARFRRKG
ncbi:hypothetical protein FQN54_005424 [Arachnomyces sp. PD_36]|nr:hypothetical protein FQN54_005424 [Arachnomyces sp. PD_36]